MDWGQWWGGLVNWWHSVDWGSSGAGAFISAVAVLLVFVLTRLFDKRSQNAKDHDHRAELAQVREDRRNEIDREEKRHVAEIHRLTEESKRQRAHQKDLIEQQRKSKDKQETIQYLYEYELQAREVERLYTQHSVLRHNYELLVVESRSQEGRANSINPMQRIRDELRPLEVQLERARERLGEISDHIDTRERRFGDVMAGFHNFTVHYADHKYEDENDLNLFSNERQKYIDKFHDKLEKYKMSPIE